MPIRNEGHFIQACLESVFMGDYPLDRLEVIVVDGESTDGTARVVERLGQKWPVQLISNPKRIVPSAMNLGIAAAQGEYIVRMDGHCTYDPAYVSACIELLQTTGAENVGGAQRPVGKSYFERGLAAVLSSQFAAGASYWVRSEHRWVDTVFLGAWKKSTLLKLGGFDEDWVVNQDYELNARLRRSGGRILYSPEIRCDYFVRSGVRPLVRQHFRYGTYRVKTLNRYPETVNLRHFAPPGLVLLVLAAAVLSPWNPWPLAAVVACYLGATTAVGVVVALKSSWKLTPATTLLLPIVHLSWGFGFLNGVRRWGLPPSAVRHICRRFWKVEPSDTRSA
jgi:glycosyltransferase involved in cell wall biosynthesis